MVTFYKYPEIVTPDKRPEIFAVKQVIATEKLHGANFRLFFPADMTTINDIQFGGRNEVFRSETDIQKFYNGQPVRWFKDQPELMQRMTDFFRERGYKNVIVYGEFCGAGIQKGVRYVQGKEIFYRSFDIRIGENLVTNDIFVEICNVVGLPYVPEVWRGEPSMEAFDALLEIPSLEARLHGIDDPQNIMEGVVIRSNPLLRNVFGEWLITKYKAEKFAEVAKKPPKKQFDFAPVETFVRTYVLRGRVINVLGHLRDVGMTISNTMADMQHLVPAMIEDLHKECESEWQTLIAQGFNDKQIHTMVGKILGGIYRQMVEEIKARAEKGG